MLSLSSLSLNSNPNYFAALTKASSSGDDELYFPFLWSIMMVWQQARNKTTLTKAFLYSSSSRGLLFKTSSSSSSLKHTFSIYGLFGFKSFPYAHFPAVNFLNCITLQVRVPVLSEKTYSTYPNSSFKLLA